MTLNTQISPYFDDFAAEKKFYRILFKPGIAVQTRELTQLQTQIQNQIAKFGEHIFADGSVVLGGQRFFENNLKYIKLDPTFGGNPIVVDQLDGVEITGSTSGTVGIVKAIQSANDTDPNLLIVKETSGSGFVAGENLTYVYQTLDRTVKIQNTNAFGSAMIFSINEGWFFVDGKFVYAEPQTVIVDALSNESSKNIGFVVEEKFVTSEDDESLLDNAQGAPNFAAPGADRYYIDLILTVKGLNEELANFIEIARVVDGQLVINKDTTVYSELEKELARRTYDESGDYTVRSFPILLKDHIGTAKATANISGGQILSYTVTDGGRGYKTAPTVTINGDGTGAVGTAVIDTNPSSDTYGQVTSITVNSVGSGYTSATVAISGDPTQFSVVLDPGKAYVKGFALETINQTYLSADRARTVEQADNIDTSVYYGSTLYVTSPLNSFDTTLFTDVELHDVARASISGATSKIGTAKVRSFKWVSGTIGSGSEIYKMSIFNITMDSGKLFKNVESIVTRSGATVLSGVNIDLLSKVDGSAGGDVFLDGADATSLVFPLNHEYVKTIRDSGNSVQTDYTFQRTFTNVAFNAGSASISTDNGLERFFGGSGVYSQSVKDQHFYVVVTAVGTSGFSVGQVLRFDGSRTITGGSIVNGAAHTVTLFANVGTNFTGMIIATINGNTIPERTKTLSGYKLAIISSPSTSIGGKNSLSNSDIYDIKAIYNTSTTDPTGQVTVDSVTGAISSWGSVGTHDDVTANYGLDNGQRDDIYDHGNIICQANPPLNTEYLVVVYRNFTHSGNGYLSVDSYGIPYDQIPSYVSPITGKTYNLRDCFDFRPRRQDGGTTLQNARLPDPDFNVNSDYQYYAPRIDLVLATADKQLVVKQGIPSLNPKVPTDESNSMRLYILSIPPYTSDLSKIAVKYIENKRYTMRDIGKIERRVQNVEYYTQLSLLEKQAQDESITDATNAEKFKNGILVDPFVGHSVGDALNRDYLCSVDPTKRELRPFYYSSSVGFEFGTLTDTRQNGPTASLDFSELTFIEQPLATKAININPFNVIAYFGTVTLEPSEDVWMETIQLPPLNITVEQNQTAPDVFNGVAGRTIWGWNAGWGWNQPWGWNQWGWQGFGWGVWNWGWWGGWTSWWWGRPTVSTQTTIQESTQSLGNNVVDIQFLPYIRQKTIFGIGEGFKPKARLYPFIDETSITEYCRPLTLVTIQNTSGDIFNDRTGEYEELTFRSGGVAGVIQGTAKTALITPPTVADATKRRLSIFDAEGTISVGQTVVGETGNYATVTDVTTYDLGDALYPDEFGLLAYEVQIPANTFRTGERTVSLIDNIDNDKSTTESSGEAKYFALGQVQSKQETLLTTRTITTRRVISRRWVDPLAQSFMVSSDAYPEGVHIASIDVYFRTKSTSVPVTLELRRMINGYPESTQTIPFGSVTLYPESINESEDGVTATNFKFDVPVHLVPDEYCFVLLANSQDYEVFVAEIGKTIVGTNTKVTQQPYTGVLFKSQNASTWTAEQLEDMKFKINRASFESSGTVQIVNTDPIVTNIVGTVTSGSAVITDITFPTNMQTILGTGMLVVGTGIPAGTTISSIDSAANEITLSANATTTLADGTIAIYPLYEYSTLSMNTSTITPTQTNVSWKVKTRNQSTGLMDSTFTNFENMSDLNLPAVKNVYPKAQNSNTNSIIIEATLTTNKDTVSPIIDIGRAAAVLSKNVINNDSANETNAVGGNAQTRYITKKVTLADGFDASNLVVTMDINKPAGTDVKVYYKVLPTEKTTPFNDEPWVAMVLESSVANSVDDFDFKEHRFFPSGAFNAYGVPVDNPISPRFNNFAIKVVMLSSNEAVVPRIRDFRAIATDN
jgi:hypothetical protein